MQMQGVSAMQLRDQIVSELDRHMNDAEQFDDITIATVIL
jgi:serine phosphatase RsbU (regulator of sigma subunit)